MVRLMLWGLRLLFLPIELLVRGLARRSRSNSIGAAVARHTPDHHVRVYPSLHVPVPPRTDYGIDLPLPPPPGA